MGSVRERVSKRALEKEGLCSLQVYQETGLLPSRSRGKTKEMRCASNIEHVGRVNTIGGRVLLDLPENLMTLKPDLPSNKSNLALIWGVERSSIAIVTCAAVRSSLPCPKTSPKSIQYRVDT